MDEWPVVTFSELIDRRVLEIGDGYRAKNDELGGDGPLFLRAGLVQDDGIDLSKAERFLAERVPAVAGKMSQPGDVLVTTKGNSTGRTAFVGGLLPTVVYSPHLSYWRSKRTDVLAPGYLRYWSQSEYFRRQLAGMAGSTDMAPYLSLTDQRRLRIELPPIDVQRRAARILGSLDDKIELNRRMTETLEAMARVLFGRWFLRAEASREWPIEPLAAHLEVTRGLSYKGDGLASTGVPLHNLNSVYEGGGYKPDGIKWYSGPYAERHTVEPGDVIVTNTEQGHDRLLIGHAALVPRSFGELGLFSHHLYRVRPKPGSVLSRSFVTYLLNSPAIHDLVSGYSNGTTVQMLPVEALQQPAIRIPPASLVRRFDTLATISQQRREIARGEARALAILRDALVPRLLSGSIEATA